MTLDNSYTFPRSRLRALQDPNKIPLIFVACGSYSPITFLHLRMFEMARDHARLASNFEVVGGYLSPVNDCYGKKGLVAAQHRLNMCNIACDFTSDWIMVDDYESRQDHYVPTARVLDHFDYEINEVGNGIPLATQAENSSYSSSHVGGNVTTTTTRVDEQPGERRRAKIVLLAGSDLIQTMSEPGVWSEQDLHHILGIYGCFIVQRSGTNVEEEFFSDSSIHSRSALSLYRDNIYTVQQPVRNDVSSTKIRLFISRGMSVRYLIPQRVIDYIEAHHLYRAQKSTSTTTTTTTTTTGNNQTHSNQQQQQQHQPPRTSSSDSNKLSQST